MLVITELQTDQGTRSPIELFWTAKRVSNDSDNNIKDENENDYE